MFATGRVLWIGMAMLLAGCTGLWLWIRRGRRPLRDSFALLGAGFLLTAMMAPVVWVIEPMQLGRGATKFLVLSIFIPSAMILVYLFNRFAKG